VPEVVDSALSGAPGTPIEVTGSGYPPGEQVNATYKTGLSSPSSISLCTGNANSDGTFSCTGDILMTDAGVTGSHKIKAKGTTSLATGNTTYTLT